MRTIKVKIRRSVLKREWDDLRRICIFKDGSLDRTHWHCKVSMGVASTGSSEQRERQQFPNSVKDIASNYRLDGVKGIASNHRLTSLPPRTWALLSCLQAREQGSCYTNLLLTLSWAVVLDIIHLTPWPREGSSVTFMVAGEPLIRR